jgi:hypothetical protein
MGVDKLPATAKKRRRFKNHFFVFTNFFFNKGETPLSNTRWASAPMPANRQKFISERSFSPAFYASLCFTYIFHKRPDDPVGTVFPVENTGVVAEWEPLPSLPPQKPLVLPPPSIAATTETAATSATQPIAAQPTLSAKPTCLYLVRIPLFKAPAEAIGVVDTDQVFDAHPLTSDSPEARADAINEIQRATAVCARAHECGVVLDISQDSIEGYPFVLSAVETLDLTHEVIQQLKQ